jgi:hypothetical protein
MPLPGPFEAIAHLVEVDFSLFRGIVTSFCILTRLENSANALGLNAALTRPTLGYMNLIFFQRSPQSFQDPRSGLYFLGFEFG